MKRKLYEALALGVAAIRNCEESGNEEWKQKHSERAHALSREHMPSGSGFDAGTTFLIGDSTPDKLVFGTSFHHMDDHGSYVGWTEHKVTVRPSLGFCFTISISGRDRNGIKDYIHEAFDLALKTEVES